MSVRSATTTLSFYNITIQVLISADTAVIETPNAIWNKQIFRNMTMSTEKNIQFVQ